MKIPRVNQFLQFWRSWQSLGSRCRKPQSILAREGTTLPVKKPRHMQAQVIALMASKPYAVNDLDDLCIHASNHSVQVSMIPFRVWSLTFLSGESWSARSLFASTAWPWKTCRLYSQYPRVQCRCCFSRTNLVLSCPSNWFQVIQEIGSGVEVKVGGSWSTKIWHQAPWSQLLRDCWCRWKMSKMVWKIFDSASDPNLLSRVFKPLPCSFEVFPGTCDVQFLIVREAFRARRHGGRGRQSLASWNQLWSGQWSLGG